MSGTPPNITVLDQDVGMFVRTKLRIFVGFLNSLVNYDDNRPHFEMNWLTPEYYLHLCCIHLPIYILI